MSAAKHAPDAIRAQTVIERIPVFQTGEIAQLERIYRDAQELMRTAERAASHLEKAAREINESIKRADALPKTRAIKIPLRIAKKATNDAKGPKAILGVLAAWHPARLTREQVAVLANFTQSTLRTYLPSLREAGLVDESKNGMTITANGLESLRI